VRVEVVRIPQELCFELATRGVAAASFEQRRAVHRMHRWQIGVERDRFRQVLLRPHEVLCGALRDAHHQACFGRVAVAKNAIDEHLSTLGLSLAQIRHSEHVRQCEIVRSRHFVAVEQRNHLLGFAEPQMAVCEQIPRLDVVRHFVDHRTQFHCGV
jgi:hypothetical protein